MVLAPRCALVKGILTGAFCCREHPAQSKIITDNIYTNLLILLLLNAINGIWYEVFFAYYANLIQKY